jgi:formylglycine-generating enzyme required for sulfatase activity
VRDGATLKQCNLLIVAAALISLTGCHDAQRDSRERAEQVSRRAESRRLAGLLESDPRNAPLLRQLANEYWAVGELDAAQQTYERALVLESNAEAQAALASLLYRRGRYLEARHYLERLSPAERPTWAVDLLKELAAVMTARAPGPSSVELRRVGSDFENSIGMVLTEVPGGSFVRGDADGDADQRPSRQIQLAAYRIGRYEVTRSQYQLFRAESGYAFVEQPKNGFAPEFNDYPVIGVSWENARAFTMWLSAREGAVYRLPTEAEWEFAARGTQGYRNPWGNEQGRAGVDGNFGRTSLAELKSEVPPVARIGSFVKDRSPFGLLDMAGNVKEWCLDEYDPTYYEWSPAANPFGPVEKTGVKVKRGGSWNDPSSGDFSIRRASAGQNETYTGNGFRVVRELRLPRPVALPFAK